MLNKKKILVIVPAKGNSKRLKNKNILKINRLPLVIRSAKEALKSKALEDYKYYPIFVQLSSQEEEDYISLSQKISRLYKI